MIKNANKKVAVPKSVNVRKAATAAKSNVQNATGVPAGSKAVSNNGDKKNRPKSKPVLDHHNADTTRKRRVEPAVPAEVERASDGADEVVVNISALLVLLVILMIINWILVPGFVLGYIACFLTRKKCSVTVTVEQRS